MMHAMLSHASVHKTLCVCVCARMTYLGSPEARFTLHQVGLHFGHNLPVRERHEGVRVVEVCRNDCACLHLVLVLFSQ